jgi:BirA family biotin operon repressor/biotin-[acetyl-CoA-carboxylase] ligase
MGIRFHCAYKTAFWSSSPAVQQPNQRKMELASEFEVELVELDEIDSTNTFASLNWQSFKPTALTAVSAVQQTAGRGSRGRSWISPPNTNLNLSFCFRLSLPVDDLPTLTQVVGLSAVQALSDLGVPDVQLKWPNDLILRQRKIGGILAEVEFSSGSKDRAVIVIVGVGINVNTPVDVLHALARPVWPASSVAQESALVLSVADVRSAVIRRFSTLLRQWRRDGYLSLHSSIESALFLRGQRVGVRESSGWSDSDAETQVTAGVVEGIAPSGELLFRTEQGELKTLISAELVRLSDSIP